MVSKQKEVGGTEATVSLGRPAGHFEKMWLPSLKTGVRNIQALDEVSIFFLSASREPCIIKMQQLWKTIELKNF